MRILYDHQVFSLQNVGGATRYHYELIRHLSQMPGVQAELFLGLGHAVFPFKALSAGNVRVTSLGGGLRPGVRRYIANELLGNIDAAVRGKFDVYHPTYFRYMPMVRARRMVVTHHDCTHERFPAEFRRLDRVLRAKQALFAQADAIICISESSRSDLIQFYNVDPAKMHVVRHGFSRFERSPQAAQQLAAYVGRDYILYVGSRNLYKNFRGCLKAFHDSGLYKSLFLLVIGGGAFSPEESALITDLHLSKSIIVFPRATDSLLAEAYTGARLLAYPSLWEGFGFPPLEAMHFGCPVLACRASSMPEVCGDAAFYFEPDSPDSLCEALLRAVNDEAARMRSVVRGREIAAQYSWEECAKQTMAVYRGCL